MRSLLVAVVVIGGLATPVHAQKPSAAMTSLESWVQAVTSHEPSLDDAAVESVRNLTYADRRRLDPLVTKFLHALTDEPGAGGGGGDERAAATLGFVEARKPGMVSFLIRAAMLHTDAALIGPKPSAAGARASTFEPGVPRSAMLSDRELPLENDGETIGTIRSDWNWTFARSLLEPLLADRANDAFVSSWYHAMIGSLFQRRNFGDLSAYMRRAGALFPDDPRILLDRGCYEERLTLPRFDAGQREIDNAADNAIAYFRAAVERDPAITEARVRLMRLLTLRGGSEAALGLLAAMPKDGADKAATYFAHLFAARAALDLNRLDQSQREIDAALALFPDAQSGLMAASQLGMVRSDVPAAEAPLRRLASIPQDSEQRADPWWDYDLCTGRNGPELMAALWARTRAAIRTTDKFKSLTMKK